MPAPAKQDEIAQDRDIIIKIYALAALRAVRWWRDYRFFFRYPRNADIQKTADAGPDQKRKTDKKPENIHYIPYLSELQMVKNIPKR